MRNEILTLTVCWNLRILNIRQTLFSAPLSGAVVLMSRYSFTSLSKFAAAFIVAVIGAAASSPEVKAGCGDYVHVGGAAPQAEMTANHAHSDAAPFDVAHQSGGAPCHGPSCRQNPLVPLDPAPGPVSRGIDHKACLAHEIERARLAVCWALCGTVQTPVDFPGMRIERPPRLGSS
jgi:hypothetical protein